MMRLSHGYDGMMQGTEAGVRGMETENDAMNALVSRAVVAVITEGEAEVGTGQETTTRTGAGPGLPTGGGAQVLETGGDAQIPSD